MNIRNTRHLFFDFDGVLGDTGELNCRIVGKLHPEVTRQRLLIDHGMGNVFEEPAIPFTDTTKERYFALYNLHLHVQHVSEAKPFLLQLARSFLLHVISSNCEQAVSRVLTEAGLIQHFGLILGKAYHPSKVWKFHNAFAQLGITPEQTAFVTDSVGDLREAAQVGVPTIAVSFGYHPEMLLRKHGAENIAHDWNEVIAYAHALVPAR